MRWPAILLIIATLVADQLSKLWLIDVMAVRDCVLRDGLPVACAPVALLANFDLVMVWNRGVSFGLFSQNSDTGPFILAGLSVAVSVFLSVWLSRAASRLLHVALPLVIGGALGNALDRLVYGAVADFFDFHVGTWHWPAFNVADMAISIGVGLLILDSLFGARDRSKRLS